MIPLPLLLTLAMAVALLASACAPSCSAQATPEAVKACQDQQFATFQQQIRDNRPAGH